MNRIVVGVDESPGSCAAVTWVTNLASRLGAKVIAVHAFEPLDHLEEVHPGTDLGDVRETIRGRVADEWCGGLAAAGVDYEVHIEEGRPADVLIDQAREVDADLIVLGSRRMGWLRSLALGSTSHRVLHEAHRPVTIIHPPEEE